MSTKPGSLHFGNQFPEGSKDPNDRVLGPNYYNNNGSWALKPDYLGPWTLRFLGPANHERDCFEKLKPRPGPHFGSEAWLLWLWALKPKPLTERLYCLGGLGGVLGVWGG